MIELQHGQACAYLAALKRSFQDGWSACYAELADDSTDLMLKLSLIHPAHLDELDLPDEKPVSRIIRDVQGPRAFKQVPRHGACESRVIWGYDCLLKEERLEHDHLFPYALGGPTHSLNRITLCRFHNMVKGNDIHQYPWHTVIPDEPIWLWQQIRTLYRSVFSIYE